MSSRMVGSDLARSSPCGAPPLLGLSPTRLRRAYASHGPRVVRRLAAGLATRGCAAALSTACPLAARCRASAPPPRTGPPADGVDDRRGRALRLPTRGGDQADPNPSPSPSPSPSPNPSPSPSPNPSPNPNQVATKLVQQTVKGTAVYAMSPEVGQADANFA